LAALLAALLVTLLAALLALSAAALLTLSLTAWSLLATLLTTLIFFLIVWHVPSLFVAVNGSGLQLLKTDGCFTASPRNNDSNCCRVLLLVFDS
jgi:hypothetical protein